MKIRTLRLVTFEIWRENAIIPFQCAKGSKQPDAYLEASVGGKVERTGTMLRSSNPVWEQGFMLLVANPETGTLHIKVFSSNSTTCKMLFLLLLLPTCPL